MALAVDKFLAVHLYAFIFMMDVSVFRVIDAAARHKTLCIRRASESDDEIDVEFKSEVSCTSYHYIQKSQV